MAKAKRIQYYFFLGLMVLVVLAIQMAVTAVWSNSIFPNEPAHSTVEAVGAMCAVVMAIFLLQGKREQDIEKYSFLAFSFLGMGIMDGFHAAQHGGDVFVFFHSLAGLIGGVGAALIWLPGFSRKATAAKAAPWVLSALLLAAGLLLSNNAGLPPSMLRNGTFTPAAIAVNLAAGVLLLAATAYFLADFHRSGNTESYLFACLYLLLGLAELEFPFSSIWSANWWFWHAQRLVAYLVSLYFLFHAFRRIGKEKERLIIRLQDALADVKQLSGLLPICASCKKIRDDKGYWNQLEAYIVARSEAVFSHGLCPDCAKKAYAELNELGGASK